MTRRVEAAAIGCCLGVVLAGTALGQSAPSRPLHQWLPELGPAPTSIFVAENGLVYYNSADSSGIRCYDPTNRSSTLISTMNATDLTVSPAGDELAFASGDPMQAIWTMRVGPRHCRAVTPPRRLSLRYGRAPVFSPDGRSLAFSVLPASNDSAGPRIVRVSASGGPERVLATQPGFAQNLRWSNDGRWIYYRVGRTTANGPERTLDRVAATGGQPIHLTAIGEFVGLSPGGRRLAYITNVHFHVDPGPKHVVIADARGRPLERFDIPPGAMPIAWRDSTLLLRRDVDDVVTSIHTVDLSGQVRNLSPPGTSEYTSGMSSDGQHVLIVSTAQGRSDVVSLDIATGERRIVATLPPTGSAFVVSGRFLVYSTAPGQESVLDLTTSSTHALAACNRLGAIDTALVCTEAVAGERTLSRLDLSSGRRSFLRAIPTSDPQSTIALVGDSSLALNAGGSISVSPLRGGVGQTVYTVGPGESMLYQDMSVSRDGAWIGFFTVTKGADGDRFALKLVNLRSRSVRALAVPPLRVVSTLLWDPGSRFVAVVVEQAPRFAIWIVPLNGEPPSLLTRGDSAGVAGGAFTSHDGGVIVYTGVGARRIQTSLWTVPLGARLTAR